MDFETTILIYVLVPILILHFIIHSDWFKDVPELYLQEQSEIDATRLINQSPIYRSNKLEMNGQLRVGLGIRYDSYKIRAGNLSDVWQIKSGRFADEVIINDISVKWAEINYIVDKIGKRVQGKVIRVPLSNIIDFKWLVIVIFGFINQITVELYDVGERDGVNIDEIDISEESGELYEYKNEYSSEKDKGIALRIIRHNQGAIAESNIEFTQLNLVCAVASTIKHLPKKDEISEKDTMVIVPSETMSNEELLNIIIKILTCLITHAKLIITREFEKYNPTVLSIHEDNLPVPNATYLSYINKLLIPRGKLIPGKLRIIYINNKITNCKYTGKQLTQLGANYNSRIIRESGYYNVVGPLILSDLYDYRQFNQLSYGCISQSLEMKIVNLIDNQGLLNIRGYVIGKTTNIMKDNSKDNSKDNHRDNEGFMPVNVRCTWGKDGCLYII